MQIAAALAVVLACVAAPRAAAQDLPRLTVSPVAQAAAAATFDLAGDLSLLFDQLPGQDASELRARLRFDVNARSGDGRLALRLETTVEGLAADRDRENVGTARVDPRDIWIEAIGERVEVRAGFGRVVWGRLDEIAPSDVVNPLDISRFLLEGRSEARRAVSFVRTRAFFGDDVRLEAVVVPAFRRGTFDALDESTSPFNLTRTTVLPPGVLIPDRTVRHLDPDVRLSNVSGGVRVSDTVGRFDYSVAAYRGFDAFGAIQFEPDPTHSPDPLALLAPIPGRLVEHHERFTMLAADFETVTGDWAWRGEAAIFTERVFAGRSTPGFVRGRSLDAGAGFDRDAGVVRVFGTVLFHRDWSSDDAAIARTDLSLIGSIERTFARERWLARAFVLVNPADRFAFVRALVTWRPVDNVGIDASAGYFGGTSDDTIGRFAERDFGFVRGVFYF